MEQEIKVYENEGFSAEATEEPGCLLSIRVTVKPPSAKKAYQKALKKVNKQISIPGFRKGHAPDRTVIGRHGSYVDQEWKEILVNDAYRAALELTDIYPINNESIKKPKIERCSTEEGALVTLAYEHYPQVPAIDFARFSIPLIENPTIPEERVDEIVEEVRRANADWETVAGRAVDEGDFVDITIETVEEPVQTIAKDRRFEVSDKHLTSWLKNLLLGMVVGESREGVSEVDPQAEERIKKNFKPTQVRVTLHAIKKILLPEINDDLAKKARADSIEDLRAKIRHNLEREAEEERKQKEIETVELMLLEHYSFDLPSTLVESERKERLSRKMHLLKQENMSAEEIKSREQEIIREISHEIDEALRLYFINKQIVKQGKITLTNQELNDEIVRYMSQNPSLYNQEAKNESAMKDLVSRLASLLMQRKAKEYALSQIQRV